MTTSHDPTSHDPTSHDPTSHDPASPYLARSTTDLVAMAPVVLGFHPRDSVVLLTFRPGGQRAFHARVDLPTDVDDQRRVARTLREPCVAHEVDQAAVLLHTDDAEAARSQAALLLEELLGAGVDVLDVVRVEEDRWFPVPEDGDPGTAYDLSTHPFTARHVFEGRTVRRDREELVASLVGTDDADLVAVTLAATRTADDLLLPTRPVRSVLRPEALWLRGRVRRFVSDRAPLGVPDAGRALVLAGIEGVRDVVLADLTRQSAPRHVELWHGLVRRAPDHLLPGVGGLLALAAWQAGDGAMAWCAVDRVVDVAPDDAVAQAVAHLLMAAVPPDTWAPPRAADLMLLRR